MTNNNLADLREYAKKNWVPVLREDTQLFLENFLKEIKTETILEVGTAIGFSSIVFSEALNDNVLIDTLEIDENRIKEAEKNIKSFGKTNINIIKGDAFRILPSFDRKYDFIFIDANKSRTYDYFKEGLRLSHKGSYIVCDNISLDGATFDNTYPAHKHRTSVFRLREFAEIIGIKQNMKDYAYRETGGKKIRTMYYEIGDGISVSEIL